MRVYVAVCVIMMCLCLSSSGDDSGFSSPQEAYETFAALMGKRDSKAQRCLTGGSRLNVIYTCFKELERSGNKEIAQSFYDQQTADRLTREWLPATGREILDVFADSIKDKAAAFDACLKNAPDRTLDAFAESRLKSVKIEGDTATGVDEQEGECFFRKTEHGWLLDGRDSSDDRVVDVTCVMSDGAPPYHETPRLAWLALEKAMHTCDHNLAWASCSERKRRYVMYEASDNLNPHVLAWYMKETDESPPPKSARYDDRVDYLIKHLKDERVFFNVVVKATARELAIPNPDKRKEPIRDIVLSTDDRARGLRGQIIVFRGEVDGKVVYEKEERFDWVIYFSRLKGGWVVDAPTEEEERMDEERRKKTEEKKARDE